MNIGAPWPDLTEAESRVLAMQTKLHQWAINDSDRCFDDLFNLVYDPAFLVVAWSRVRGNKGGRTAGVDGVAPRSIDSAGEFLNRLREDLKARRFIPSRVRQKTIPKASGKVRHLGIPTAADRVVQASLKLVIEPIFEADFYPCSYGFRPRRRAQDAIAEIHFLGTPSTPGPERPGLVVVSITGVARLGQRMVSRQRILDGDVASKYPVARSAQHTNARQR